MLDRLSDPGHSIIIGDRGYESFQMVADLEAPRHPVLSSGQKAFPATGGSLQRQTSRGAKGVDLPFTCQNSPMPIPSRGKQEARQNGWGRIRPGNRCFSYVSKDSPTYTSQPMRVADAATTCRRGNGYTSLRTAEGRSLAYRKSKAVQAALGDRDFFPGIKICPFAAPFPFKRWTYVQEIFCKAYHVQLQPHDYQSVEPEVKPGKNTARRINHTYAAKYARIFRNKIGPSPFESTYTAPTLPIRPDRHYERQPTKSSQGLSTKIS